MESVRTRSMNAHFSPTRANGIRHIDHRSYCRALAERLEVLIAENDDPRMAAMHEIAEAAERDGLIDNDNLPRRDTPTVFVVDLLLENPVANDWMSARLECMPHPQNMTEIGEVAAHLL